MKEIIKVNIINIKFYSFKIYQVNFIINFVFFGMKILNLMKREEMMMKKILLNIAVILTINILFIMLLGIMFILIRLLIKNML